MTIPPEILKALHEPYLLTAEQVEAYQANGYIFLPEVASLNTIEFFRDSITTTTENAFIQKQPVNGGGYAGYFMQVSNLWLRNELSKAYVFAKRFAGIAAQLMKVKAVRLYHDQALLKQHGGLPTPWHQDQFYWPIDSRNTVTMWMPLGDCPREMGSMTFARASHVKGQIGNIPISTDADRFFRGHISENKNELTTYDLRAGDATFHSGWTVHCAGANNTRTRRDVMTIIYYEDTVRISVPANSYQQVDMEAFFPGLQPGDIAASDLNPLLGP